MSTLSLLFFLLLSPSALHQRSWAVIFHGCALSRLRFADRPYSLEFEIVGALYERPRCIFCAKPSPSEQFTGIVGDPTGAAIAGAKVQLSGSSFNRETYTDSDGRFIFDEALPGDYSILITATAFAPYSASIHLPTGTFAVTLQIAPRGEHVLVTATRVETPVSMLGVSATAIDHDHIAQQQSPPVYELLREVPGIAVAQT